MESRPSIYIGIPFTYVLAGWFRGKFRQTMVDS